MGNHNVPKGSETHFKVLVVTDAFNNMSLIQRHREVNKILDTELKSGVHALSILAKTPDQWSNDEKVTPSPNCMGGLEDESSHHYRLYSVLIIILHNKLNI